jgi:hypothetical protein
MGWHSVDGQLGALDAGHDRRLAVDAAAERYMALLRKTHRHFVEPVPAAVDVETIRQLVKRLVVAGKLDLSDLTCHCTPSRTKKRSASTTLIVGVGDRPGPSDRSSRRSMIPATNAADLAAMLASRC